MYKSFQSLLILICLIGLIPNLIKAQTGSVPPPPPPPPASGGSGFGVAMTSPYDDNDDTKVTGATVRGRVVYEDTGRPLRYALISLVGSEAAARYSSKYVKTDENGNFVMKTVKAGNYTPYVRSEGILTPDNYKNFELSGSSDAVPADLFEKVAVNGLGEIQIVVRARRGGAISGRVAYADGEAAVGVKVEALRKVGERFVGATVNNGGNPGGVIKTDDRGFYRLSGLSEGNYIIRISEPISNSQGSYENAYNYNNTSSSLLKTYFPEGENARTAREIQVAPGQEQSSIDVTLPERQLFAVSGMIITKKDRQPLEKFSVNFRKISDPDQTAVSSGTAYVPINSKKSGAFAITGLPKGKYLINVSQAYVYRDPKNTAAVKTPEYPSISKEIEIIDRGLDNVVFEIPVPSSLSGTVIVEGGKDVPQNLNIFMTNDETKQTVTSSGNYSPAPKSENPAKIQNFRIGKLSEGKYRIFWPTRNYYVKSISYNGRDVTNAPVEIGEGEDLSGVQIVLANNFGTIKGKVAGFVPGVRTFVIAFKSGAAFGETRFGSYSSLIKPDGSFEIKIEPGDYSLIIINEKTRPQSETDAKKWYEDTIKEAPTVTVKSEETQIINLNMTK